MKLIDRDELLATIEADMVIQDVVVASDRDARILENLMRDILNDIKESPIVDAVPVEFIKGEIKDNKGFYNSSLRKLLDVWAERKEE